MRMRCPCSMTSLKSAGNVAYVAHQSDLFVISSMSFKDQRAVTARIIESDSLCSAFADALDELSESDLAASAWLTREIALTLYRGALCGPGARRCKRCSPRRLARRAGRLGYSAPMQGVYSWRLPTVNLTSDRRVPSVSGISANLPVGFFPQSEVPLPPGLTGRRLAIVEFGELQPPCCSIVKIDASRVS